jgi:CHAT domain-containing protein
VKPDQKENSNKTIALFGGINYELDSGKVLLSQKMKKANINDLSLRAYASDTNRSNSWIYLGGTLTEVNNINKLFKEKKWIVTEYIGKNASEETFKSLTGKKSPAIFHISTHGFFFPEADSTTRNITRNPFRINANPLYRSGLILAGANYAWQCRPPIENTDDGVLTSYEVANSNLSNTELVVLSACETGLGDIKTGEGVYGLQRAFQVAGAKAVIMSLWSVPDRETTELMSLFYNYWLKGTNKHNAFRQAQLELAKKYPSYYWAAFVLVE